MCGVSSRFPPSGYGGKLMIPPQPPRPPSSSLVLLLFLKKPREESGVTLLAAMPGIGSLLSLALVAQALVAQALVSTWGGFMEARVDDSPSMGPTRFVPIGPEDP